MSEPDSPAPATPSQLPTAAAAAPSTPSEQLLAEALARDDAEAVASLATEEQLRRLKAAEDLLAARYARNSRGSRATAIAQLMVGYVALAGFFANAYQNWTSKKQAEERAHQETERWSKEFRRAQDADKYRAFFETSALATDPSNPDKRLVGYALLKEFVDDPDYSTKAIFMLEESLALELRNNTDAQGLDEQRRLAVVAILAALSHSSDCKALGQAARSVDKLVQRRPSRPGVGTAPVVGPPSDDDSDRGSEVFGLYVRRLVGRAAQVCLSAKDFREVRRPLREALQRVPALGGSSGRLTIADANQRIAEILHADCLDEAQSSLLSSDCAEVLRGYARLCETMGKLRDHSDETGACTVMQSTAAATEASPPPPVAPPPAR